MKRPYATSIILTLSIVLSSCYSFNHYVLPPTQAAPLAAPQNTPQATVELGGKQCEMYIMPAFTSTPDLPFDEILAADKNNPRALDQINSKHIADLRDYIARFKSDIRASHNEYLRRCYRDHGMKVPGSK